MRRTVLAFLLASSIDCAVAQGNQGEPSALACIAFRAEAARVLDSGPDALQVNNLLFEASRRGCAGSLDALFEAGASRLARDRSGNTALAIAAKMGRLAVAERLLASASAEEASQLDLADVEGSTPLLQAALANRGELAKRLIGAGAEVDAANRRGETPLIAAAFSGNGELASLLLARKARPDAIDGSGKGVIVYAAARGAASIVEMLLDAGVDPNARYGADLTALMWAAGHPDNTPVDAGLRTVKLLLSRGAKVDLVDDRGRSALMIAAGLGHAAIIQALLEAGADRGLRDKAGASAVDLAAAPEIRAAVAGP